MDEMTLKGSSAELTTKQMAEMLINLSKKVDGVDSRVTKIEQTGRANARDLREIKEEYPLLPPEADDLSKAVKKKGVEILGGKNSAAYKDTALRRRVYQDIYLEVKRNYGLIDEKGCQLSYKKLKRRDLKGALGVVTDYAAPTALQNEIQATNEVGELDD